jgi:MFS family permease
VRLGGIGKQGRVVLAAVAIYGLATLGFSVSRTFFVSMAMLAIIGASDTVSTVLRQTIRQLVTPDYLRGRMTSVNMIFFMGGPQLGEFEAGVVARVLGAPASVFIGGVGCLIAVLIATLCSKNLREYQGAHHETATRIS